MSELAKRVLFAIPAAAFFLYLTWLGGTWFYVLIIVIALFSQRELEMLSEAAGYQTANFFPYTIGLWILLSPKLGVHTLPLGLIIFTLFAAIQIFKPQEQGLRELISTLFCGIYIPLGLLPLILIRTMGSPSAGFALTIALLLMVWGNDIAAYFGGKTFGKTPFAPTVSPKKTWEGFIFGILGAVIGLLLVFYLLPQKFPVSLFAIIPAPVLVSFFGPIGDLTASRFKRAANVKDASNLLPGHGGFFDRFDALLLAAPVFYCYLYLLKVLGYASF